MPVAPATRSACNSAEDDATGDGEEDLDGQEMVKSAHREVAMVCSLR